MIVSAVSGLDNGRPFPLLSQMDQPVTNPDGSVDVYFGPMSPDAGKNWLATVAGKPFWVALRLYGPEQLFFDRAGSLATSRR